MTPRSPITAMWRYTTSTITAFLSLLFSAIPLHAQDPNPTTLLVVVGSPGAEEYEKTLAEWAARWQTLADQAQATCHQIGLDAGNDTTDKQRLLTTLNDVGAQSAGELWLVLIGHGTFDGQHAKFNLRGPDVTATELQQWLAESKRPTIIVNCASCSGPFINRLSGDNRVVVSATKSGYEMNYARFGDFFSAALGDLKSDLDKDGQVSLLEAFLMGSARVREFYDQEARLATETALLDDNGDGLGTPADWFRGIHPVRQAKQGAALDGIRAHQFHLILSPAEREMPADARKQRDQLEQQIAVLRGQKTDFTDEDAYYTALEPLLVQLAQLYEANSAE